MNRRRFLETSLRTAGALYAGLALSACTSDSDDEEATDADAAASSVSLPGIGLQLYTIRNVLKADFRGTMDEVAQIGYDEVEFAGYYDRGPEDIGTLLEDLGLAAPATHVPLARIREAPDTV
ncbi:MAG: sugar phosphate isomerase/epimerase, partial [Salinibacter sp.]